ncbi:MAG: hypothetical protein ACOX24_03330 [Christensenellales bacterium]|jgi:hypothetical protein|nr:hypothetical protein [Clostridiales bacterium]
MKNQSLEILKIFVDTSKDGRYVIIDFKDFFNIESEIELNKGEIEIIAKDLEVNGYIEIKFINDDSICAKPTKLGFGVIEGYNRKAVVATETLLSQPGQQKSQTIKNIGIFIVAFLGSLMGSAVVLIIYLMIKLFANK